MTFKPLGSTFESLLWACIWHHSLLVTKSLTRLLKNLKKRAGQDLNLHPPNQESELKGL